MDSKSAQQSTAGIAANNTPGAASYTTFHSTPRAILGPTPHATLAPTHCTSAHTRGTSTCNLARLANAAATHFAYYNKGAQGRHTNRCCRRGR